MSSASVALICTLMSGLGMFGLAASDPKRRRQRAPVPRFVRHGFTLVALAPGLWLAMTTQGTGFLLWIGASAILGWIIAALVNQAPR